MKQVKRITKYALFWERKDLFDVTKNGRIKLNERGWYDKNGKIPPLKGARGIYILYRGTTPVYVGKATEGADPIVIRLRSHARGWYSHAWDNVSWFHFEGTTKEIEAVEALLIACLHTTLNGVLPASHLGEPCYPGNDKDYAKNELWKKFTA